MPDTDVKPAFRSLGAALGSWAGAWAAAAVSGGAA